MKDKCKHEWEKDPLMESGAVVMLFGKPGEINREMRFVCKKCKKVKYEPIKDSEDW